MATVDILLPGQAWSTNVGLPAFCSIMLVESEGTRILLDTGHVGRCIFLEAALKERNLGPEDIDMVVMTHAHWDHAQNFDRFPNAPMLLHPAERKYAQKPAKLDWATPGWTGAALETHPKIQEVTEGDELAKGVTVFDMPGHSPGSIALLVETDQGISGLTGDALHFAEIALTGENPLVFHDKTQADESIRRMVSAADVMYPGHDDPFRLVDGKIVYTEDFQVTLTNITPTTPGLSFEDVPRSVWIMPGAGQ
jgi:glyoxylase-like metal-dependent hydrolase (beta-lactamase superfamily II)